MPYNFFILLSLLLTVPSWADPYFKRAIDKLSLPASPNPSPYTHLVDTNLDSVYLAELRAARIKTGIKNKAEKNKGISRILNQENANVRQLLSRTAGHAPSYQQIAEKVYQELTTNKISDFKANQRYDKDGKIGFCFGRATMVHYLLLQNGVKQDHIAKVFALGKMKYGEEFWDFHMATMVRGPGMDWLVIDALADKVMPHGEWMDKVSAFDPKKDASFVRFYVTDPRKFQPSYKVYEEKYFEISDLKTFFSDLFKSLN